MATGMVVLITLASVAGLAAVAGLIYWATRPAAARRNGMTAAAEQGAMRANMAAPNPGPVVVGQMMSGAQGSVTYTPDGGDVESWSFQRYDPAPVPQMTAGAVGGGNAFAIAISGAEPEGVAPAQPPAKKAEPAEAKADVPVKPEPKPKPAPAPAPAKAPPADKAETTSPGEKPTAKVEEKGATKGGDKK